MGANNARATYNVLLSLHPGLRLTTIIYNLATGQESGVKIVGQKPGPSRGDKQLYAYIDTTNNSPILLDHLQESLRSLLLSAVNINISFIIHNYCIL